MTSCDAHREAIAQDPSYNDAHLQDCNACRSLRADMQALDRQIAEALALPVPELKLPDLPEIDSSKVTPLPGRRFSAPAWLAVAATVTVAAVLGFRMLAEDVSYPSLADQIIAHLDHEPYALNATDRAVSDDRLARIVPADVATMDHSSGVITYAQSCVINGHTVPHLVIQGEHGPITILLMPEDSVSGPQEIHGERINGVIIPIGNGSIAIFGEDDENLERIQKRVVDSVTWST